MATFDELQRLALALPEVVEADGAFEIAGKGFTWVYAQKVPGQRGRTIHPGVWAVRVSGLDEKELLLAANPAAFFSDDHYRGYPAVLVRLEAIEADELEELLIEAWRLKAPRKLVKAFDTTSGHGATSGR